MRFGTSRPGERPSRGSAAGMARPGTRGRQRIVHTGPRGPVKLIACIRWAAHHQVGEAGPRNRRRRRLEAQGRPVRGWRKPSTAACRACRGKSSNPRSGRQRSPLAGTRRRYTGSPTIGWPDWAMWTRIWCVRPVASRHSTSARRRPRPADSIPGQRHLATRATTAMRLRSRGSRPIAPSICPGWAMARPSTKRGRTAPGRASRTRGQGGHGQSVFATTMTPDVSLSRRWTMPGRRSPPMPAARRRNAPAAR